MSRFRATFLKHLDQFGIKSETCPQLYQPTQEQLAMKITSLARWMSGGLRKSDIRILSIDKLAAAKMANAPFFVKTFASFIACCGDSENKVGVIVMEFVTGIDLLRYFSTVPEEI